MCQIADRLRTVLYSLSTQYTDVAYPLADSIKASIILERERPEYQAARDALREHFRECEICHIKTATG